MAAAPSSVPPQDRRPSFAISKVISPDHAVGVRPVEALTERERTVLRYLATSMPYAEIASSLFVSLNTVKTHAKKINVKLQASSRAEAVDRARQLHYL